MRDLLQAELKKQLQPQFKALCLAEFIQHLILQSLFRHGGFKNLTFTGGTALRLLYHTPRYSEDLDFSLTDKMGFEFSSLLKKIQKDLSSQQFPGEMKWYEEKTVAKATLKFAGLLKDFGISPLKDQKVMVKLEVDCRPPDGGAKEIVLVPTPVSYQVTVFDLPSLFATKLHAVFFRSYAKGRDYYDLLWYLGKRVKPNFPLLNRAIAQSQGEGHEIHENDFAKKLIAHLEKVNFEKIRGDLSRFLIRPEELQFVNLAPIKSLLRNY